MFFMRKANLPLLILCGAIPLASQESRSTISGRLRPASGSCGQGGSQDRKHGHEQHYNSEHK